MQQMTKHRPLAELDLLDDFLFNALLAYPEYGRRFCRKFLRILFGRDFKNLNIVTQKSYGGLDTGYHGARLDVYIEEGDEVEVDSTNVSAIYDIEPDKNNKRKEIDAIPQRTRFYHAIIDRRCLKSGQSYDRLKKVFVIFICPYDPFGDNRMIYTIRNQCVENPELPYDDGARTIFLYTKGEKGRDNETLSQLLDYMENTTRENASNRRTGRHPGDGGCGERRCGGDGGIYERIRERSDVSGGREETGRRTGPKAGAGEYPEREESGRYRKTPGGRRETES